MIVAAFNVTLKPVSFAHNLFKGRMMRPHIAWSDCHRTARQRRPLHERRRKFGRFRPRL